MKRAITASAIGNATEWFDYGIYAYGVSYNHSRHAEVLSKMPGDSCQSSLHVETCCVDKK